MPFAQSLYGFRPSPVVAWADAGCAIRCQAPYERVKAWPTTPGRDPNASTLMQEAHSMEADFRAGDRILLEPSSELRNRDCSVAKFSDAKVLLKHLRFNDPTGSSLLFESPNPDYATFERPRTDFRFIHPVVDMVRRIRRL